MIHLRGHQALITGSTQGVGRSIAEAFAAAGADVVIHGLSGDGADEVLEACRARGVQADLLLGDLAGDTRRATAELFAAAVDRLPRIDILVNNAGTYDDVPFLDMEVDRFERTMRLNVAAPFFLTQTFARHWVADNVAGRVLMTGSINGRLAEPTHAGYDTSKGALEMMVKTLCVELAPHQIRVNGMAPGLVRTPLTRVIDQDAEFEEWMCLHTPNGCVPGSDVCGGAAVFLVSDYAEHIHGQMLLVDGGMSVWQQPEVPSRFRAGKSRGRNR